MTTMTDELVEIRDLLLREEKRLDRRIRECFLSRRKVIGQPGLPFGPPGVADFIFGGWTRYFFDYDPRTPEQKDKGEGPNTGLPTGGR